MGARVLTFPFTVGQNAGGGVGVGPELARVQGACPANSPFHDSYQLTCGAYAIIHRPFDTSPGEYCYYDAATGQRLAYLFIPDIGDEECAGEPVPVDCTWSHFTSPSVTAFVCARDGGAPG